MTVLKPGSTLTTGGNVGDTAPAFLVAHGSGAGLGVQGLQFVDYLNAPIHTIPQTVNGNVTVYGDFLRAFPSLAGAIAGAAIGFDSGNPNGRNPTPVQFPEGTTGPGLRLWAGTGAPSSTTIGGTATPGDVYIRRDGAGGSRFYKCTVGGAPGTWVAYA